MPILDRNDEDFRQGYPHVILSAGGVLLRFHALNFHLNSMWSMLLGESRMLDNMRGVLLVAASKL